MRLSRLISRRWAILLWLTLLVLALTFWAVQPWILSAILGLNNFQDDGRLTVLKKWLAGRLAPLTPIGLLSLFPILDLMLAASLLGAIAVLLFLLWRRSTVGERGPWLTELVPELRFRHIRIRFWAMLVLIAIFGLECGWEQFAWRSWNLRQQYLGLADGYATSVFQSRAMLRRVHNELARLDADATSLGASTHDARAQERDFAEKYFLYTSALIRAFEARVLKYSAAANHALQPIPPDPPLPARPEAVDPIVGADARDHGGILAAIDELIRSYPKNALAHERRAWILATCPVERYRDGGLAVASATRACELTNWQEASALCTLAAAHAEAGDFAVAVYWEKRASELSATPERQGSKWTGERLALYQAGKPFRLSR